MTSDSPVEIQCETCLNYSLIHAGLQSILRRVEIPDGTTAAASIPGFTPVAVRLPAGVTTDVSPALDLKPIAELSHPRDAQLIVRCSNGDEAIRKVTVLPVRAWDQRREYAAATAAFVLENDPFVLRIVRKAEISHATGTTRETCERLYRSLSRSFECCYLFDRGLLTDYNSEQYVRFPSQVHWDMGGTCIDLALLIAASAYAAGMRPALIFTGDEYGDRHALVGLFEERRDTGPAVLTAREVGSGLERHAMLVIDPVALANDEPFERSIERGLELARAGPILWGVGIEASRLGSPQVSPLPEEATQTVLTGRPTAQADAYTTTRMLGAAAVLASLRLEVTASGNPGEIGRSWRLGGYAVSIGRSPHNQVHLSDPSVSRDHAILFVKDGRLYVKDAGSRYGTFVAGVPIEPLEPSRINAGDKLRCGAVEMRLYSSSEVR